MLQFRNLSGPHPHANVAFYFIHSSAPDSAAVPLTLQEALENGAVRLRETGKVQELSLENVGDLEVFGQAGDLVKGGRQDRVLSNDLLLPPRSGAVPIPVFCVEFGRWGARQAEDAATFSSCAAAMPSHRAKVNMRAAATSMPERRFGADPVQAAIWEEVNAVQKGLAWAFGPSVRAGASPSSLQLSLESESLIKALEAYVKELQMTCELGHDIVGSVVAISGKIKSGDIYLSNALFRKMWPKILAASATEAIAQAQAPIAVASPPPVGEIDSFLGSAEEVPETECSLNHGNRLAIRQRANLLYAELRRPDGSYVHQNYLTK